MEKPVSLPYRFNINDYKLLSPVNFLCTADTVVLDGNNPETDGVQTSK